MQMIRTIPIDRLQVGMFVHDLQCSWLDHPFLSNQFAVKDAEMLRKIRAAGVREVAIDTKRGADLARESESSGEVVAPVDDAARSASTNSPEQATLSAPIVIPQPEHAEEVRRARKLHEDTSRFMNDMMADIRLGKQIEVEQCEPLVDGILDSIFRCPGALLPLAQVKTRDEYTFQHSASVSALCVAFGRALNLPRDSIKDLALGGLLHDVGKALVPLDILNKPGKLTEDEFAVMKGHAARGAELLKKTGVVSDIVVDVVAQHHERFDGTGYPGRLKGVNISLYGQMAAIADVYDAITSLRVYHKGMPPTEALRRMYEWSKTHFNPSLVQAFIRGLGIYPVGSLVRMASGRMGIVREVAADRLLQPVVKVFFDADRKRYVAPAVVDLSAISDSIVSHESFDAWGIDQARWL